MKNPLLYVLLFFLPFTAKAQTADTVACRFHPAQLIVPAALLGAGVVGLASDGFKGVSDADATRLPRKNFVADEVLRWTPLAGLYLANWCGLPARHSFRDRTMIALTATILAAGSTYVLKHTIRSARPDNSDRHGFPSGHTAIAFMGAELLRREYASPWVGVAGYAVATTTAVLRVTHRKHYWTDVAAGAGLGILSAQAAYWLFPLERRLFRLRDQSSSLALLPFASPRNAYGISAALVF